MTDAGVQCPFFRRMTGSSITCEGLIDRSTIQMRYGLSVDQRLQVDTFCCNRYTYCEIYQAIHKAKYEA